jgi:hypothetical protein
MSIDQNVSWLHSWLHGWLHISSLRSFGAGRRRCFACPPSLPEADRRNRCAAQQQGIREEAEEKRLL